jgi:phosphatidate cytidylyltransferase
VLQTRLKTALVALPATLALIVYAPSWLFGAAMVLLALWGLFEIGEMAAAGGWDWVVIALAGGVPAVMPLMTWNAPQGNWLGCAILFVLMAILIAEVGIDGPGIEWRGPLLIVMGAASVGVLFPYFAMLHNRLDGMPLIVLMLLLVVASDSGAYFVGKSIGRIKLLPKVSPGKTVEGAVGGLAGAVIAGLLLRSTLTPQMTMGSAALLALFVSMLAQIGDLGNSAFKRVAGVKDSGWIFPGHGGLLDRTCSLVFPAVLTYYYVR